MGTRLTLAVVGAAATLMLVGPGASAAPPVRDAKQITKTNVAEKAGYYHRRHYWRRGWYDYGPYYGHRRYYRRPGFGIYLGF